MPHPQHLTIAVIGAGFSGTMAAIHLLRTLPADHRVLLCERSGRFARGLAYASTKSTHLLNVRAANMSAFADDPGHFDRWLEARGDRDAGECETTEAGRFATRRLYGAYLRSTLYQALRAAPGRLLMHAGGVEGIAPIPGGYRLAGEDGFAAEVAGVVFALGGRPAPAPDDGLVFRDPWTDGAVTGLRATEPVLIVGTGLTMVDLALEMRARGFAGQILLLSRRALVPHRHAAPGGTWKTPEIAPREAVSLVVLLRRVRTEVAQAAAAGIGWRAVIDSLRPITMQLWQGLPKAERSRFLRHLRPIWDVHRHRTAPPVADQFAAGVESGTIQVLRGRIRGITPTGSRATVQWQPRGGRAAQSLIVQRVVMATGLPELNTEDPLIAGLLVDGLARSGPHALGLDVTDGLAVLGAAGVPTPGLWALGPLVRGVFWECVAVPDIRVQAGRLAATAATALQTA